MMLVLTRSDFQATRTVGRLTYDGRPFGYAVEDADRGLTQGMSAAELASLKVSGQTAIAAGVWPVVLQTSGRYGPETLTILVDGHRFVRIHAGNDEGDTEGCLCPGLGLRVDPSTGRAVATTRSARAVEWLHIQLRPHLRAGGEARIRIERDATAWASSPYRR